MDISNFKSSGMLDDAAGQKAKKAAAAMPTLPGKSTIAPPLAEVVEAPAVPKSTVVEIKTEILEISLNQIRRSPFQVRHVDIDAIDDLMESLVSTNGLVTPIVVRKLADGLYELISGHTRLAAAEKLGYAVVPAYVREYTDSEAAKALAADNLTRKDLSDFEIFKQLNVLFAHGYVKSNSEASHLLGRTRQDIIRYQAFGKMPAEVIELLEANPKLLGASTAKTLADWVDAGHEAAVIQGCLDLANNKLKTQVALVERLIANSKEVPARAPSWGFNITDTNGRAIGKVSITNNSIRITGSGLNFAEIETLLRRELPDCKLD